LNFLFSVLLLCLSFIIVSVVFTFFSLPPFSDKIVVITNFRKDLQYFYLSIFSQLSVRLLFLLYSVFNEHFLLFQSSL